MLKMRFPRKSVSPAKAELTAVLQEAKVNGMTLEDIVRLAVEIYS